MNDLLAQGEERQLDRFGRPALREALNQALDRLRERWRGSPPREGDPDPFGDGFWTEVEAILAVTPALGLRRAVNATGVVLHTGLGRAPWPSEAQAAAVAATRYADLEVERESGRRGRREHRVAERICALTGAGAALAVNNNAAAVLLALSALARGRKVVLSRGEMVEIGGSYRMPEVVRAAGARMLEVGTTNRTRLTDYEAVLDDPEVACVLKVHPSNYRLEGFTSEAGIRDLAPACRERGLPLVYDLGSGVLTGIAAPGVEEPTVRGALGDGADLVTFSGDKLLGGPQAGIVAGARPLVERLRRDVLTRCLRLDKAILAALEAVLALHALGPEAAARRIPALRMLAASAEVLRERANAVAGRMAAHAGQPYELEVVETVGRVGSGAAPEVPLAGAALAVRLPGVDAEELARRLRLQPVPVFARVHEDRLLLDLRTVSEGEEKLLVEALAGAVGPPRGSR